MEINCYGVKYTFGLPIYYVKCKLFSRTTPGVRVLSWCFNSTNINVNKIGFCFNFSSGQETKLTRTFGFGDQRIYSIGFICTLNAFFVTLFFLIVRSIYL